MSKPLVAIVGRPNVGKSTLFNKIVKKRISIIEDTPGVTRDRILQDAEWLGYTFTLIDTGGIEPDSDDIILRQMRLQAELAMETADVIIFLTDAKSGLVSSDFEVAEMLRHTKKPVILAVNKVESREDRETFFDFYQLGFSEVFEISAEQSLGLGDLLDAVVKDFERTEEEEEEETTYITIVGKPNVGKSTLSNQILGEERSIVSDIPGTTRDAIDSSFYRNGRKYTITDTAGLRKKSRIEKDTIERYSVIRSLAALRRADVVLFLVDAEQGVTDQDLKIAGYINDEGKPCVLLINKWDAIEKDTYTIESYKAHIANELPFLSYAPQIYISAKTGQRVQRIFDAIDICLENTNKKITTGLLNDTLRDALTSVEPPSKSGMRLKIFYGTQVAGEPPTFLLFVNNKEIVNNTFERYLLNYFRKTFDFTGTPIRFIFRDRNEEKDR